MHVPKEIKQSIRRMAKLYTEANELNIEFRDWLAENNANNDTVLGQFIDIIELSAGSAKEFIDFLEKYDNDERSVKDIY
jgi:hypothetical protein